MDDFFFFLNGIFRGWFLTLNFQYQALYSMELNQIKLGKNNAIEHEPQSYKRKPNPTNMDQDQAHARD